jgi:hypothetical protein
MKVENKTLVLKITEFYKLLNSNPDKSKESERIKNVIFGFVLKNRNILSKKQMKWVVNKLNYIIKHNKKNIEYKNISKFEEVYFISERSGNENRN